MTALLELAPRDAGTAPGEVNVEFLEGTSLHEIVACSITCTVQCHWTEATGVPSADDDI